MTTAPIVGSRGAVEAWWDRYHGARSIDGAEFARPEVVSEVLTDLAADVLDRLPLPGSGRTTARFAALTGIGEIDLNLGRLAEAHADAVAILAELAPDYPRPARSLWGVWAAEDPRQRLHAGRDTLGRWSLEGRKGWCSGATGSTHALVTADDGEGSRPFAVELDQPAVRTDSARWPSPTLAGADTRAVEFHGAVAVPIGAVGSYLTRPGFWHGAAGVAAVWYGGAVAVGRRLLDSSRRRDLPDIDLAHLGAVDAALTAGRAVLLETARAIDADPDDRAELGEARARSTRAVVEASATEVIDRVGRALGPSPFVTDDRHWRKVADLQLYLRQSHADRDLAELGRQLAARGPEW
ncbi:MAG TPA: acyl-CoA dehydrogenase [Mycobacteriales bacterium]|nr:acyl-CoA dehydrogenase [Mycobacteriales bacterium]